MSNVAQLTTADALALARPDLRHAPAIFRSAVKLAAQTWYFGGITFVLPSGPGNPYSRQRARAGSAVDHP